MSITLLPLRVTDIRTVYQLEQDIFPKDAYSYLDLAFLLSIPWMCNIKAQTEAGEFAGFIAVAGAFPPGSCTAWIITVGVAKRFQNQGIGRRLLQTVEPHLPRANRLNLTVRESNAPAIHLYETQGYQHLELKLRYYRDGENGLVMSKRLQSRTR